jgi:hypothetical protein
MVIYLNSHSQTIYLKTYKYIDDCRQFLKEVNIFSFSYINPPIIFFVSFDIGIKLTENWDGGNTLDWTHVSICIWPYTLNKL